jgi:MFS family permease
MRSHRCTRQRLANHLRKFFERQVYTSVVGIDVAMISPSSTSKYRNDLVDQSLEVLSAPLLDNSFGNDGVAEQSCCSFDCRRRWSMFIIILLSLLNFTCRFTYAGVLSQLQEQFQKTDGEMGFSQTAFVLAYMFAAPIFGYLNDAQYFSCRSLVTVSCLIFSGAAFCSGLSSTYLEFLASRAVLGVGEAGFSVLAPIIIKALFEGSKSQPTAIALYYSSTAVGSALGFIVGGTVGGHWGWRYAFFSAGPPGVLLSVLFLVSAKTESANSIRAVAKHRSKDGGTVSADVVSLLRVSSYMFSTFGFASLTFAVSGLAAFMPVYLARQTDIKESVASTSFGVVACLSGIIGPFSGDALTKYLAKKRNDAAVYVCALGLGLSVPFGVASILIPYFELPFSVILCYASSFLAQLFFFSIMSPNLVSRARIVLASSTANSSFRESYSALFRKDFTLLDCKSAALCAFARVPPT